MAALHARVQQSVQRKFLTHPPARGEYGCTCVLVVLPLCCTLEVRPRGGIRVHMCARGPALVLHLGGAASWRDYIQVPNKFLRETPRHCAISRIKGVSEFLTEPL